MACNCGKRGTGASVIQTPVYNLSSDPVEDNVLVYIQQRMHVISQSFNRIFKAGSNIIMPVTYAEELVSLNASVLIQ